MHRYILILSINNSDYQLMRNKFILGWKKKSKTKDSQLGKNEEDISIEYAKRIRINEILKQNEKLKSKIQS